MHKAIASVLAVFIFLACATARAEPIKIHMISGSREYKSEESLKALKAELEELHDVQITASWVKDGAMDLPNIDKIPGADLLIVFTRRIKLPEEQMAIIRKHWESGKPIVGMRTASHAFQKDDNETFDRKVMGGNYQGHFGGEAVKVTTAGGVKHPVLEGVQPFESKKLYKAGPLAETVVLLQNGSLDSKKETHAVTWINEYNGGRMFYTSLGVPSDFENDNFKRMIINAIFWTTGRK